MKNLKTIALSLIVLISVCPAQAMQTTQENTGMLNAISTTIANKALDVWGWAKGMQLPSVPMPSMQQVKSTLQNPYTSYGALGVAGIAAAGYGLKKYNDWYSTAQASAATKETYKIIKSAASFHVSILYNHLKYGNSFTFNQLAGDATEISGAAIERDAQGNIVKFNDGKRTPLILGSIPRHEEHIKQLRTALKLPENSPVALFTMNRHFERDWSGLTSLMKRNESIRMYEYPTTDYSAPSMVDLIRVVRDLDNRDSQNDQVAYVHCKAGRGRSAAAIVAYLLQVCHDKMGATDVTIESIESYLKLVRPQVSLNPEHKVALKAFKQELKTAGSLANLVEKYKTDIDLRDKEFLA